MKTAKTEVQFKAAMTTATTAQLLAFYNERTGKAIKKFSSRANGEKQCLAAFMAARSEEDRRSGDRRDPKSSPKSLFDGFPASTGEAAATKPVEDGSKHATAQKNAEKEGYKFGFCPSCGSGDDQTAAGKEGTVAGDQRNFCHGCSTEYDRQTGKIFKAKAGSASRSEAIRKTWADRDVADKRSERTQVQVDGTSYRSVREAFQKLGLPIAKHIAFRMQLKAAGSAEFGGKKFSVIEAAP